MTKALTTQGEKSLTKTGGNAVAAFAARASTVAPTSSPISQAPRTPRVIFAMDATASRAPTWSRAQKVQAEMFRAMEGKGEVQLASYGGGAFRASAWASDARELLAAMQSVHCVAGMTQISDTLAHVARENRKQRISAAVFVGDTVEENAEALIDQARRLGTLGIPVFVFHEVGSERAEPAMRSIAAVSGGAYARFQDGDPLGDLQPLLGAVAAFADGGRAALLTYGERSGNEAVKAIGHQLKLGKPD